MLLNQQEILLIDIREIEDLRSQISELESQLQNRTPNSPNERETFPISGESLLSRGFLTNDTIDRSCQFYGLSSLQNLIHRLKLHLHLAYGWIYSNTELEPKPVTLPFSNDPISSPTSIELNDGVYMNRAQEEECLGLFSQTYHCQVPILDERDFKEHHAQIWTNNIRSESPLVDIILAICIQYGMSRVQKSPGMEDNELTDPSNAGRWYFQRCQCLLKAGLEKPTITQLQCQILSAIYLRDASCINMALSTIATASQTAYALGFHLESNAPRIEREFHQRLLCMVYVLESKMNMDCGRPFVMPNSNIPLPGDDHELASVSEEMFIPFSKLKITWLTYHQHHVKLIGMAREAFKQISNNHADILLSGRDWKENLQDFDIAVTKEMNMVKSWLDELPFDLQCQLTITSNDEFPCFHIHYDHQAPLWLQRQRVMLRLFYHDIMINLCRSFILFPSPSQPALLTGNSNECLSHAIAITDIIHQVLQETDALHGWHRAYQFQWNAAISLVAIAFSDPTSLKISLIMIEIEKALVVLQTFGRNSAIARSAGQVIQSLQERLQLVISTWS